MGGIPGSAFAGRKMRKPLPFLTLEMKILAFVFVRVYNVYN